MFHLQTNVDGQELKADVDAQSLLLEVLRGAGHIAPKEGCGIGVCGACTVLVDDVPVSSCIYPAVLASDREVWTAEGLSSRFPDVRDRVLQEQALQCGACTPGQFTAICALALSPDKDSLDSEEKVRDYMSGNLCRCTGYEALIRAAQGVLGHE